MRFIGHQTVFSFAITVSPSNPGNVSDVLELRRVTSSSVNAVCRVRKEDCRTRDFPSHLLNKDDNLCKPRGHLLCSFTGCQWTVSRSRFNFHSSPSMTVNHCTITSLIAHKYNLVQQITAHTLDYFTVPLIFWMPLHKHPHPVG